MNTVEDRLRAALTAKSDAVGLADDHIELPEPVMLLVPAPHQQSRWRWPTLVAAALVLIVVGATVVAGHNRHPHQLAAGRADVPWSQVGPNWTLVVAVPTGPATEPDLDLISPAGVRYRICQLPAPFVELRPWMFGTGKALLTDQGHLGPDGTEHDGDVLIVDLRTGAQTRTSVSPNFDAIQFASPGLDSLLVSYPSSLQLISAGTGRTLARYPFEGSVLGSAVSPNGAQVVAGSLSGLVVFDRASGRRTHTLASPAGYWPCQVLRWLPASNEVLAECLAQKPRAQNQDFTFAADGERAPRPDAVPAGWQQIRLATGSVAYQQAEFGYPGPLNIRFAEVSAAGRLLPLTVPAELEQGRWELAAAGADVLVFEQHHGLLNGNQDVLQLAAWNPLTGTFTILFSGAAGQPSVLSHTSWQQYSPTTLP